jgi:hypothetical protein
LILVQRTRIATAIFLRFHVPRPSSCAWVSPGLNALSPLPLLLNSILFEFSPISLFVPAPFCVATLPILLGSVKASVSGLPEK